MEEGKEGCLGISISGPVLQWWDQFLAATPSRAPLNPATFTLSAHQSRLAVLGRDQAEVEQPAQGGLQSLWAGQPWYPEWSGPGRGEQARTGGPPEATLWPFPWPHPQASERPHSGSCSPRNKLVPHNPGLPSGDSSPSDSGLEAVSSLCVGPATSIYLPEQRRRKKPTFPEEPRPESPARDSGGRCRGTWLVARADRTPPGPVAGPTCHGTQKVPHSSESNIWQPDGHPLMLKGHSSIGYHQRTVLWPREHDLPIWRPCRWEADPGGVSVGQDQRETSGSCRAMLRG